jgi:drug/metabolite transporter (DMT)-like permease
MFNTKSLYAIFTAIAFGCSSIFVAFFYEYSYMNESLIMLSSTFYSVLLLFFVLIFRYKNLSFLKITKKDFIMSFFCFGLIGIFWSSLLGLISQKYIALGIQRTIAYSTPLFIIIINFIFLHKKPTKINVISVILILTGLTLVVGKIDLSGDKVWVGLLTITISAIIGSIYSIIEENVPTDTKDNTVYLLYTFISCFIYSIIYTGVNGELGNIGYLFCDKKVTILTICCGFFSYGIPYLTYRKSITIIGAIRTNIFLSLVPVVTVTLAFILFEQRVTILQVIGIFLVILASAISVFEIKESKASVKAS